VSSRSEVLAVALIVLAGCGGPRPGREPFARRIGDWERVGPVERFDARRLFEAIDGEAPSVLAFGFRSLAEAEYRGPGGATATIDLFDMTSPLAAFGLFRFRTNFRQHPLQVGSEGAGGSGAVDFWQGSCYVAIASAFPKPDLVALAHALAERLPPGQGLPHCLALLPENARVPRSEEWVPTDFMGHEFLKNVVKAEYAVGDRTATVFAATFPTPAEAAGALARLRSLPTGGKAPAPLAIGEEGFVVPRPYLGRVAVFRLGRRLGGMLRYGPEPAALAILKDLAERMRTHTD